MTSKTNQHYYIIIILLLIVGARTLWLYNQDQLGVARFPDEKNYYLAGAKLFYEQGWSYFFTERSFWNTPFSVLWIALFKSNIFLIQIVNLLLVTTTAFFVWDLARKFYNYKLAWISLVFHVAYRPFTDFGASLLSEGPACFFIALSVWLSTRSSNSVVNGSMLGVATLFRPATQLFPLFIMVSTLIFAKPFIRHLFLMLLGFFVLVLPYSIKNYINFGSFSLATGSGAVLYLGNDLRTNGNEPIYYGKQFDTFEITKPHTHLDIIGDQKLKAKALDNIMAEPKAILYLYFEKFLRLMYGSQKALFYPAESLLALQVSGLKKITHYFLPLFLQAIIFTSFIFTLFRKTSNTEFYAKNLVLYFLFLHSALFAIPRMMMPVYPLVIFLGLETFQSKKDGLLVLSFASFVTLWLSVSLS